MNLSSGFGRKLIYLLVLVAMLVPLYLLGQPAGGKGEGGGQLAEMRTNFDIAESDLGEISPASETMRLASLGLRGVAGTLLWNKSHRYKTMHEWDRFKAALNNIALLQPHFEKVWEFQAWNVAYNVSREFDDYRQRYEMVREGTEFLTRGVNQNRNAPRLIWYTGWFYGKKIGDSDEKRQFRRLFADDEKLHEELLDEGIAVDSPEARGPLGKPDNWLVGRLWLHRGYELVDTGVKIRRQTPLNFYETGPKWRFEHAEAIEEEGILDDRAQNAWQLAYEDWIAFGNRSIPTTAPFTIKLDQTSELQRQLDERAEELKRLAGPLYGQMQEENIAALDESERELLNKPEADLTRSEEAQVRSLNMVTRPNLDLVARRVSSDDQLRAINLVGEIKDLSERLQKTEGYRNQINYPYWKTVAKAEQEERTVRARRLIYQAEQANAEAELDKAIDLYEQAFAIWADIFDDYPLLVIDESAEDLYESIRRYSIAIDSDELPADFPLRTLVDLMGESGRIRAEAYDDIRNAESNEALQEAARKQVELRAEEASLTPEERAARELGQYQPSLNDSDPEAILDPADEPASNEPASNEPNVDGEQEVDGSDGVATDAAPEPAVDDNR